jgi:hypothetical protein
MAPIVADYAEVLRKDDVDSATRQEMVRDLRQHAEHVMENTGVTEPFLLWSLPDQEEGEEYEEVVTTTSTPTLDLDHRVQVGAPVTSASSAARR